MTGGQELEKLGVADAKRRFSELLDRVQRGERFIISRRGRPAVALVPPAEERRRRRTAAPRGLVTVAGSLADWKGLNEAVDEIYAARRSAKDRSAPELE
jgi:prevent-host-death family protein